MSDQIQTEPPIVCTWMIELRDNMLSTHHVPYHVEAPRDPKTRGLFSKIHASGRKELSLLLLTNHKYEIWLLLRSQYFSYDR